MCSDRVFPIHHSVSASARHSQALPDKECAITLTAQGVRRRLVSPENSREFWWTKTKEVSSPSLESGASVAHYYFYFTYFVDGTDYDSTIDILDTICEVQVHYHHLHGSGAACSDPRPTTTSWRETLIQEVSLRGTAQRTTSTPSRLSATSTATRPSTASGTSAVRGSPESSPGRPRWPC